jgi:DNA-binding MarR family transcriptional regulator
MTRASKAHRRWAEEALSRLGIYVGQEMILMQLWIEEGIPQSQLAACIEVEAPTMTKMLQRMERSGLVERRPDPQDARISLVYLTERSRELEQPVLNIWRRLEELSVEGMTEAEQILLRRLLRQMEENLS